LKLDKKNIIVFAPHPDDETLGCGGTIAKRIRQGYKVLIVIMTDGRYAFKNILNIHVDPTPDELKALRKEEVKRATTILGVQEENLIFLDFVDGRLENEGEKAEEKITKILSENHPVEVYFPHKNDGHPDHRATYRIVKKSIRKLAMTTFAYQYSITPKHAYIGPIADSLINRFKNHRIYSDISKFVTIKEAALKEFESELTFVSCRKNKCVVNGVKKFLRDKEIFYTDD
jgi:LmbE family N-acetylglucosaminyl deacetylase